MFNFCQIRPSNWSNHGQSGCEYLDLGSFFFFPIKMDNFIDRYPGCFKRCSPGCPCRVELFTRNLLHISQPVEKWKEERTQDERQVDRHPERQTDRKWVGKKESKENTASCFYLSLITPNSLANDRKKTAQKAHVPASCYPTSFGSHDTRVVIDWMGHLNHRRRKHTRVYAWMCMLNRFDLIKLHVNC